MQKSKPFPTTPLLGIGLALVSAVLVISNWEFSKVTLLNACAAIVSENVCRSEIKSVFGAYLMTVCMFPPVLLIELFFRAKKDQPLISTGVVQDVVWFSLTTLFRKFVLLHYVLVLYLAFDNTLPFLHFNFLTNAPVPVQVACVLIGTDFVGWFHHWVRHKVPLFWEFHKLHHSTRELNFFSDARVHPVDDVIATTIRFIPFLMLNLDIAIPTYFAWEIYRGWHTQLTHSNVKTDLWFFRYVLTSPQSHRIHHSVEKEHQDLNLGVVLSIWDWMFGTQWKNFSEYPDTGIEDSTYPHEIYKTPLAVTMTVWRQFLYPFSQLRSKYLVKTKAIR